MTPRLFVLFCLLASPPLFSEDVLLVLKNGKEVFGTVVTRTADGTVLRRNGKLESFKRKDIARTVPSDRIDAELSTRRKKIARGDAAPLLRLALLALEVRRKDLAAELVSEALHFLSPPAVDPQKAPALAASSSEPTWPPTPGATVKLEVKKKFKGKISEDLAAWSQIKGRLESASPPFDVLPGKSARKPDYIFRVGFDIRIRRVIKMFDSVPISNEWEAIVRFTARSGKTGKALYTKVLPPFRKSCSVNLDGETMILNLAVEGFLAYLKKTPAFRISAVPKGIQ